MCGRFYFKLLKDSAFDHLRTKINQQTLFEYASEEVFPTQQVLVLLPDTNDYTLKLMQWGIKGYRNKQLINARSETLATRKTFQSMLHKRCLIPCNGFYEWTNKGKNKNKIYMQRMDTPLFYLAGIYNDKGHFVIVTGEAQEEMKNIHERTPIIVQENDIMPYLQEKLPFIVDNSHISYTNITSNAKKKGSISQQLNLFDSEMKGE